MPSIAPRARAHRPRRTVLRSATTIALAGIGAAGCEDAPTRATAPTAGRAASEPGVHRQYGAPVQVGEGRARAYVVLDRTDGGRAIEFGIALDERALDGLPHGDGHVASHAGGHHEMPNVHLLPLPAQNPTPFRLVELNWNASGHEPPGVYDAPHFDAHFYTVTKAERDAIDPSRMTDAEYVARSMNYPADAPPFYVPLAPPGPNRAVPQMGVHWSDVRSPELQIMLGNPEAYRPFTATFTYGSWDGRFTFVEPMVTRAHLLATRAATDPAERDQVRPIPTSAGFLAGAFRPDAYRIRWDAQAREYHIAVTTTPAPAR